MKTIKLKILITAMACLSLGLFTAQNLRAAPFIELMKITGTAFAQRGTNDNGTITTIPTPDVSLISDLKLLQFLAIDEHALGNWPSNSFPAGARLMVAESGGNVSVVKGTNVLLDVSNIMSFSQGGVNEVRWGKISDQTGLARPTQGKYTLIRFNFDDTAIVGGIGLQFHLQGLGSHVETDTVPVNGFFTRTRTSKITQCTGEGTYQGNPFVCTGTIIGSGRGTLPVP